jgi:hypothetical protein
MFPFGKKCFDCLTLKPLGLYVNLVIHLVAYSNNESMDSSSFLGTSVYFAVFQGLQIIFILNKMELLQIISDERLT